MRKVPWSTAIWLLAVVAIIATWMVASGSLKRLLPGNDFAFHPPALLQQRVSVDSAGEPARKVLARLAAEHGLTLQFDSVVLQDVGLDGSETIHLKLKDVPLAVALHAITRAWDEKADLTVVVNPQRLLITDGQRARSARNAKSCLYTLEDLAVVVPEFQEAELGDAIVSCLGTDWRSFGGDGYLEPLPGALLVGHGQYCHAQVHDLLAKLTRMFGCERRFAASLPIDGIDADWHVRIRDVLEQPVTWSFRGESLELVVQQLREEHHIPAWIAWRSLQVRQPKEAWRIHFECDRTPLHLALDRLTRSCDLQWSVNHGTLSISRAQPVSERDADIRLYNVSDLIACDPRITVDDVSEMLRDTVHPDTWDWVGGFGCVHRCCGGLLIRQSPRIHREIEMLFAKLRQVLLPNVRASAESAIDDPSVDGALSAAEAALEKRIDVDYEVVSLKQSLEKLEQALGVPIEVDPAFVDRGTLADQVALFAESAPAFQVLDKLTSHFFLDYVAAGNRIQFVPTSQYFPVNRICVYDVSHLVGESRLGIGNASQFAEFLPRIVDSGSWDTQGGMGAIAPMGDALVVTQSVSAHSRIRHLLAALERVRQHALPAGPSKASGDNAHPRSSAICSLYPNLERKLDQQVRFDFVNVAWHDFVLWVSQEYSLPLLCDFTESSAFPADGIPASLSIATETLPLETALELALRPHDLSFQVRHGVVCIVPYADHEPPTEIRLIPPSRIASLGMRPAALAALLRHHAIFDSWLEHGWDGRSDSIGDVLGVSQTRAAHDQIERLLDWLDGGAEWAPNAAVLTDWSLAREGSRLEQALAEPWETAASNHTGQLLLQRLGRQMDFPIACGSSAARERLTRLREGNMETSDLPACRSVLAKLCEVTGLVTELDRGIVWLQFKDYAASERVTRVYPIADLQRRFGLSQDPRPVVQPSWQWIRAPRFRSAASYRASGTGGNGVVRMLRTCVPADAATRDIDERALVVWGDSLLATVTREEHTRIASCLDAWRGWAGLSEPIVEGDGPLFYDVTELRRQYPELSEGDWAKLLHDLEPRFEWDRIHEVGDLCVVSGCLAVAQRALAGNADLGNRVQQCLDLLSQLPAELPRPAAVWHLGNQHALKQLERFFDGARQRPAQHPSERLAVSYALVMTHRLAGDSAPLEDHLREFSREVLAMNDASIDWQFYRTWQCVSSRAIDVWDIYTRLAARPMSFARRHELVRQLVDSGLDCGSLVGPMLHQLPPSEFKALIKELERAGPTASSALPYVFAHLGGPNERFVIRTLKAIDPDGRACWNLFRDKELQASDPPQRILALEKVLRRQFGAPRR